MSRAHDIYLALSQGVRGWAVTVSVCVVFEPAVSVSLGSWVEMQAMS